MRSLTSRDFIPFACHNLLLLLDTSPHLSADIHLFNHPLALAAAQALVSSLQGQEKQCIASYSEDMTMITQLTTIK